MKKIIVIVAIIISVVSCKTENKKVENAQEVSTTEISKIPVLALGEFDTKASEFVNKEVQIKGIVDHVCKHGGKKLLLVDDNGDVHVTSDVRFEDALKGSKISLTGVVLEKIIDEAYCLKMEEDNIKSHSEGKTDKEKFEEKKKHVQEYRDQMKAKNIDHISIYSLKYIAHTEIE